jgi:hypothetical protein
MLKKEQIMCRNKESGGRRCPSHSNPEYRASLNAKRREKYAANKVLVPTTPSPFAPISERRLLPGIEDTMAFHEQSDYLRDNLDFQPEDWEEHKEDEDNWAPDILMTDAILYYTGEGSDAIKYHLDNVETSLSGGDLHQQAIVANLDSVFALMPELEEPRTVYRGMKIPSSVGKGDEKEQEQGVSEWLDKNFPVGSVVSQKNYMSTTLEPNIAIGFAESFDRDANLHCVIFEINSKQGVAVGEGVSYQDFYEKEVLMPRQARFKVAQVYKGTDFHYEASGRREASTNLTVIQLVDADEDNS